MAKNIARIRINIPKIFSSATSAVDYVSTLGVTQCEPKQINLTKKNNKKLNDKKNDYQLKTVDLDRARRYLPTVLIKTGRKMFYIGTVGLQYQTAFPYKVREVLKLKKHTLFKNNRSISLGTNGNR